jgi:hypothetical protein
MKQKSDYARAAEALHKCEAEAHGYILVPSDKTASPKGAHARSVSPSTKAASVGSSDKTTSPKIDLGQLRISIAQIRQQRADALMIALDGGTRPVQLQQAGQNFQRCDRHGSAPAVCSSYIGEHQVLFSLLPRKVWLSCAQSGLGAAGSGAGKRQGRALPATSANRSKTALSPHS